MKKWLGLLLVLAVASGIALGAIYRPVMPLLAFAATPTATPFPMGRLAARFVYPDGQPAPNIHLLLLMPSGLVINHLLTDNRGMIDVQGIQTGDYFLEVLATPCELEDLTQSAIIKNGKITILNICVRP